MSYVNINGILQYAGFLRNITLESLDSKSVNFIYKSRFTIITIQIVAHSGFQIFDLIQSFKGEKLVELMRNAGLNKESLKEKNPK